MSGRVVDLFADAGELAHQTGQLSDALTELAIRLDLAGAGELLTLITDRTCWAPHAGASCPTCGHEVKRDPEPHPRPQTPPPPPPPPSRPTPPPSTPPPPPPPQR